MSGTVRGLYVLDRGVNHGWRYLDSLFLYLDFLVLYSPLYQGVQVHLTRETRYNS
jgi:hypothetical protein